MKYQIIPIIFFLVLGVVFFSLLLHEGVHIIQSKSPRSICYDIKAGTFMHVTHDNLYYSDSEFKTFKSYTEKTAGILMFSVLVGVGILIGLFFRKIYSGV